jgi:hypothetical protein
MYYELLVLSLETLCKNFDSTYLDPSFYPTLRYHGYTSIIRWFRPAGRSSITQPSIDHHNIAIPIHAKGCHWLAVCHRRLASVPGLVPRDAIWINCENNTYQPHSNECGPRTILALAVFMSHPTPSRTILHQYMNPNLAMQAKTWMGHLLLTGQSPLLPPQHSTTSLQSKIASSAPCDLVSWLSNCTSNLNGKPNADLNLSPSQQGDRPSYKPMKPAQGQIEKQEPTKETTENKTRYPKSRQATSWNKTQTTKHSPSLLIPKKSKKILKTRKLVKPPNQPSIHDFLKSPPSTILHTTIH